MYFLFVLQQKGYPVFDVFEDDIRNIETYRFSKNLDEEYKKDLLPISQEELC